MTAKVIMMPLAPNDPLDLTSEDGFAAWRDSLLQAIRSNFENDGHLVPVAFFVAQTDPKTRKPLPRATPVIVPVMKLGPSDNEKDGVAIRLRQLARLMDATAVMFAAEAWQRTPLGQVVGEILVCTVERVGAADQSCYVSYVQRADDKATASEWDTPGTSEVAGRFASLLRDEASEEGTP